MAGEVVDGRYRLESRISRGGMAEVWAARDLELDRRVALKLLAAGADRLRFAREARAAASLSHLNICQAYDYGEAAERAYIVLEYLPGGTLEDWLTTGEPLRDADTVRIAVELASALAHGHSHGIVHRDVKPANVLFDAEGRAKLADFGIARSADVSTLTEAGTVLGSAAYISPEQANGEDVTAATDVYAFGVLLYRMLTGFLPFEADDPLALAAMHISAEPPPIRSRRPDAPLQLERVATSSLAKRPEDRPADGSALLAALPQAEPDITVATRLSSAEDATQVIERRRRQIRARHVAAGVALAAVAAGGTWLAILATPEPSRAPIIGSSPRSGSPAATTESDRAQSAPIAPSDSTTRAETRNKTTRPRAATTTATSSPVQTQTVIPTSTASETATGETAPPATTTGETTTEQTTTTGTTTAP